MDGNGSLFGTLQGNTRDVLHKFTVDLPKKHGRLVFGVLKYFVWNTVHFCIWGRGGQSALRFARLRMEKRHNYVRKVAEVAVEMFIRNDKVGRMVYVFNEIAVLNEFLFFVRRLKWIDFTFSTILGNRRRFGTCRFSRFQDRTRTVRHVWSGQFSHLSSLNFSLFQNL